MAIEAFCGSANPALGAGVKTPTLPGREPLCEDARMLLKAGFCQPFSAAGSGLRSLLSAMPGRLSGLRVRDQGRAPLGGNFTSDTGSGEMYLRNRRKPRTTMVARMMMPPASRGKKAKLPP